MKITLEIDDKDIERALKTAKKYDPNVWIKDIIYRKRKPLLHTRKLEQVTETQSKSYFDLNLRMGYLHMLNTDRQDILIWSVLDCDEFTQYAAFGELRHA